MNTPTLSTPSPATPAETDAIVIGAGPAGLFQLFQLGLQGLRCHAIDALPHPGGQCAELYPHKPIYDIPALAEVSGAQLAQQLHRQLAPFPIEWHWGHTVNAIDDADDGLLQVRSSQGLTLKAKAVVLALGVGAFVPRLPKLDGLDALLARGTQVFVQSQDHAADATGRDVIVLGGDEAAVAKALQLAALPGDQRPARIRLLHRRDVFKAEPAALAQLRALRDQGAVEVAIGQPQALRTQQVDGQPSLRSLLILDAEGNEAQLTLDLLLLYQGIFPKLGALQDWGLQLDGKLIAVNPASQASSRAGIHAVGDIASYPGKRKLIVSAFHEATLAAFAIAERIRAKPALTLYTTTSTQLLERLGKTAAV